jgi:hypothetical protein
MWAYGHHFRIKDVDDGHMTQDCGVEVELDQSSCASHLDQNTIHGKLGYTSERYKRSFEWSSLLSNVLFLGASGGTPLIRIM